MRVSMKSYRLLIAIVGLGSTLGLHLSAAPPSTKVALKLAVPWTTSNFALSADRSALLWAGREAGSGFVYAAPLSTGQVCLLYELPDDVQEASEIMLRPIPANSDRLLVGFSSRGATGGWDLFLLALDDDNDLLLTESTGPSDGNVVLSPSGLYLAAGTGFTCFGGGHDCSPQSVSVFSTDDGRLELSLEVPSRLVHDSVDGSDVARGAGERQSHEEPTLESFWWCESDLLTVRSTVAPDQVLFPSSDGTWRRGSGQTSCPEPRKVWQNDSARVQPESVPNGTPELAIRWEPPHPAAFGRTRDVTVSVTVPAPATPRTK